MPGNYGDGFDVCQGDMDGYPGIYGTSTFHQGEVSRHRTLMVVS